jgi:hypothetical protein
MRALHGGVGLRFPCHPAPFRLFLIMLSRNIPLIILAALFAFAAPVSAKGKKKSAKQTPLTWRTLADYVVRNGDKDSIKAPTARNIGYESDVIDTISLGIEDAKSKDGREHNFEVVYEKDVKGALKPKEIIIGTMLVKVVQSNKEIDGYEIRLSLDGSPIRGMHATGIVGHVVQQTLKADSKELLTVLKSESTLYLKEIDLAQLTK